MNYKVCRNLLFILLLAAASQARAQRIGKNLDFDWRFHLGEIADAETSGTDSSSWQTVDVPHDWSIEQGYTKSAVGGRLNGFLPGGIGWYKKEFAWDEAWAGKKVAVLFEGVYMNSTVWINGHQLGFRPSGYLDLYYDLTPYLTEGKNILSVRVDNSKQPSARWYTGCGIYRPVSLIVTDNVRFGHNATYVHTPEMDAQAATVKVEMRIENLTPQAVTATLTSVVEDASGKVVAQQAREIELASGENAAEQTLRVETPGLWSVDTPVVYYVKNSLKGPEIADDESVMFGIRKMEFLPDEGFKLNGVPMKLKGVCMHQDAGAAGSAVNADIWRDRIRMLKSMGCNAIRTSHHPFSREFYTLCDTMGMLVMNELWDGWFQWPGANKAAYDNGSYFLDWWQRDLEEFICRDRNHACIAMWSLGNEVWGYGQHKYLQKTINDTFHRLDPYHPTTQAWATDRYLDIAGFNGNGEGRFDLAAFRKDNPKMLAVGTEIPHTRQTRGVYRTKGSFLSWDKSAEGQTVPESEQWKVFPIGDLTDAEVFNGVDLRYASGYDNQTRRITCREQWKQTRDNDYFIGEFRWTGYDYLGESWDWPARTNNYGVIDMAGFPKDAYYLYQSFWLEKPMVHMLPHWTHPGKEGIGIPVVVYTNCEEAELFLDGKSLGRKPMDKQVLQIVWTVPYRPGTLTAVAYKDGRVAARERVATAGKAARVQLTTDRSGMKANRRDIVRVVVDIVDGKGQLVPYANNEVKFEVSGPYKLIGVENGDILDMNHNKSLVSKAFMGKTLLLLQATDQPGTIRVTAKSAGLASASRTVICR